MLKRYFKKLAVALVMALVVTMFVPVQDAEATPYYSGLRQPAIYTNKIVLNIDANSLPKYDGVSIKNIFVDMRVNTENYNRIATLPGGTRQITITGVNPHNSYDIQVSCAYTATYSSSQDYYVGSVSDAAMAPVKLTGLKQRDWYYRTGELDTVWNEQQSTTGYQYQLYNYKNKIARKGTITNNYSARMNFEKLSSQTYKMRVRAYTDFNGRKVYGAWSSWLNVVPPVKKLDGKAKAARKKITIKWPKVKGATSYTIYVSTKKDSGYKKTKTVSGKKTKATIGKIGKKRFKLKKTYYIMVRPNKKVKGKTYYSKVGKNMLMCPVYSVYFYKTWVFN